MSPIAKAVSECRYRIPRAILEKVFVNSAAYFRPTLAASVESQIESLVIRPRVMVDMNLVGGIQALIPLQGLAFEMPYQYTTVIHIPKSRTQGRSINSVRNVTFFNAATAGGMYGGPSGMAGNVQGMNSVDNSAAMSAAAALMASFDKIPQTSTSSVSLIAENTILINDGALIPPNSYLRCVLENEDNLNNLPLRSYRHFSNLVEFAVKAYIYNALIIEMDAGELRYGQTLGAFKEIVSSYADANQNYQDYLKDKMEAIMFMSDETSYTRYIKMMVGGMR